MNAIQPFSPDAENPTLVGSVPELEREIKVESLPPLPDLIRRIQESEDFEARLVFAGVVETARLYEKDPRFKALASTGGIEPAGMSARLRRYTAMEGQPGEEPHLNFYLKGPLKVEGKSPPYKVRPELTLRMPDPDLNKWVGIFRERYGAAEFMRYHRWRAAWRLTPKASSKKGAVREKNRCLEGVVLDLDAYPNKRIQPYLEIEAARETAFRRVLELLELGDRPTSVESGVKYLAARYPQVPLDTLRVSGPPYEMPTWLGALVKL